MLLDVTTIRYHGIVRTTSFEFIQGASLPEVINKVLKNEINIANHKKLTYIELKGFKDE